MAVGDLVQVTLHGTYKYMQPILNVFHYEWLDGDHAANQIASWFGTAVGDVIRTLYYPDYHFEQISVRNLFDPSFGVDYGYVEDGSRPGIAEELPTHDSAAIRFRHLNPAIRGGYKRFGAPTEVDQLDGTLEAAFNIYLNNVANAILSPFGPLDAFVYVIVKRILVSLGVYRLPENLGEAAWGVVNSADLIPRITTQNSRKIR